MFIQASGQIYPGIYLLKAGDSCCYAVVGEDGSTLISDPGPSCHIPLLLPRLATAGIALDKIKAIVITHSDVDRLGGIPLLRTHLKKAKLFLSTQLYEEINSREWLERTYQADKALDNDDSHTKGSLSLEEYKIGFKPDSLVVDSDLIEEIPDAPIRVLSSPGHTKGSTAYLALEQSFLIVDETFGYFHGRKLPGSGSSFSLEAGLSSIDKISKLNISGIGFPYSGAITGNLVVKHLTNLIQTIDDAKREAHSAWKEGLTDDLVKNAIKEQLYSNDSSDRFLVQSMNLSLETFFAQLKSSYPN